LGFRGTAPAATGHGAVAPDGTVYLPRGYCGRPFVAISDDEGDTWERVQVAGSGIAVGPGPGEEHEASVAIDANGTVYYTWQAADRLPYLAVSRDRGKTWSKPVLISPPGVDEGWDPFIDVGDPGRVAISYVGTVNSPGPPFCVTTIGSLTSLEGSCFDADGKPGRASSDWDKTRWTGYMAVSVDATSAAPTFHTAPVGSFEDPLYIGVCGTLRCGVEVDFLDVIVGPDGTAWASFVDGCNGAPEPSCVPLGAGVVSHLTGAPPLTGQLPVPDPAPGSAPGPAPGAPAPGVTPAPPAPTCAGGRVTLRLPRTLGKRVRLTRTVKTCR